MKKIILSAFCMFSVQAALAQNKPSQSDKKEFLQTLKDVEIETTEKSVFINFKYTAGCAKTYEATGSNFPALKGNTLEVKVTAAAAQVACPGVPFEFTAEVEVKGFHAADYDSIIIKNPTEFSLK